MSTNRHIDKICAAGMIFALLLMILFVNGEALGIQPASRVLGYETRLFDPSRVHTLEIMMDDWEEFLDNCTSEEYSPCTVLIDNEAYKNIAIRGKGNTSLSTVARMDSQRYSFKIEFDHYDNAGSYHGLDKLSLNNIIQDNTYMKDYLAYRLMDEFGADAPLCSYVWITVNGEDWGLYLAVEGVEDSFLRRNYGADYGNLYKPDSQSFGGGGPGNGRNFDFNNFFNQDNNIDGDTENNTNVNHFPGFPGLDSDGQTPDNFPGFPGFPGFDFDGETPDDFPEFPGFPDEQSGEQSNEEFNGEVDLESGEESDARSGGRGRRFSFSGAFGGMGSSDVKLQYIDDEFESYNNIFNNAKTNINSADKTRLIASLKSLGAGENLNDILNIDEIIRYFVVHNYVCNGDSYTGSIIHNYYLYEQDGKLSMIPWDYNLAFGTFQSADASGMVNDPIDTPMSISDASDRPMFGWIMNQDEYLNLYHDYFNEFLNNIDITGMIDAAHDHISSYVAKDPTAFCTPEEFETAAEVLREFCVLRSESVFKQLSGEIPSTKTGQSENSENLIDVSGMTLSDMGNMGMGGGGFGGGPERNRGGQDGDPGGGQEGVPGGGQDGNDGPGGGFPGGNRGGRGGMNRGGFGAGNTPDNMPDMTGRTPGQMPGEMPDMPGGFPDMARNNNNNIDIRSIGAESWILLGGCVVILLAGILIADKTRRWL